MGDDISRSDRIKSVFIFYDSIDAYLRDMKIMADAIYCMANQPSADPRWIEFVALRNRLHGWVKAEVDE
jgi:hypothetical protein